LREQEASERTQIMKQAQEDRATNQRGIADDRQDREAFTAFTTVPAGGQIMPRIAGRMRNLGLPVQETPGVAGPAAVQGIQSLDTPMMGPMVTPESTPESFTRGATQADTDKAAAATEMTRRFNESQANAATARQETQDFRAEQAGQQRGLQLQIAQMGNATRQDAADARRTDAQAKVDEKKATAEAEKQSKRKSALRATDDTLAALDELLDVQKDPAGKEVFGLKPGVSQLYGARIPGLSMIPGTASANASASMNRLRGRLVVDLLGELKSQSKTGATGFGALSDKELGILQSSASKLENSNMSDQDVIAELSRIREHLLRVKEEPSGMTPVAPNAPKRIRYDTQGNVLP
jgi:hypothetical protein